MGLLEQLLARLDALNTRLDVLKTVSLSSRSVLLSRITLTPRLQSNRLKPELR